MQSKHESEKGSWENHASIHLQKSNICTNANKKPLRIMNVYVTERQEKCASARNVIIPTPPHPNPTPLVA